MNSENSKTYKSHDLIIKLTDTDKLELQRVGKRIALSYLGIYYTCKNIKSSYSNNRFKISAQT